MRRTLAVVCLFSACGLPPDADRPLSDRGDAIIGGRACGLNEEPATVAVLVDAKATVGGSTEELRAVICTGTLIAPDTVVSAAHCVDPAVIGGGVATVSELRFYVSFESDLADLADGKSEEIPSDSMPVKAYVENPAFAIAPDGVGPQDSHDVSVLFLAQPVSVVPEIVVQPGEEKQLVTGASVQIAGYGQQTETGELERPPDGTIGIKECATSQLGELGPFEMQVGSASLPHKCHGDSGGPTFLEVTTPFAHKRRLVGITSHSYDDTDCAKGGIDTRVDAVRDWIDQQLRKGCANGTRSWCDVPGLLPADYEDHPPPASTRRPSCRCDGADALSVVGLLALALARRRRR